MNNKLPEGHHKVKYVPGPADCKYVIRTKYPSKELPIEDKVLTVEDLAEEAPESVFFSYPGQVKDYGTWEVWKIVPADMTEFNKDWLRSFRESKLKEASQRRERLKAEIEAKQEELRRLGD